MPEPRAAEQAYALHIKTVRGTSWLGLDFHFFPLPETGFVLQGPAISNLTGPRITLSEYVRCSS
jgi:hypothetical protein